MGGLFGQTVMPCILGRIGIVNGSGENRDIPSEVVDDGFGGFDECIVFDLTRLIINHGYPRQFLPVFRQTLQQRPKIKKPQFSVS